MNCGRLFLRAWAGIHFHEGQFPAGLAVSQRSFRNAARTRPGFNPEGWYDKILIRDGETMAVFWCSTGTEGQDAKKEILVIDVDN